MARRRFTRATTARRSTNWIGSHEVGTWSTLAANACVAESVVIATGDDATGTITRIRGRVGLFAKGNAAVEGIIGMGLLVATTKAFVVGTTALPCPLTDASDEDWLWHTYVPMIETAGAAPAEDTNLMGSQRVEIDSKAMRKFEDSQSLIFVIESSAIAISFTWGMRALIKLH